MAAANSSVFRMFCATGPYSLHQIVSVSHLMCLRCIIHLDLYYTDCNSFGIYIPPCVSSFEFRITLIKGKDILRLGVYRCKLHLNINKGKIRTFSGMTKSSKLLRFRDIESLKEPSSLDHIFHLCL